MSKLRAAITWDHRRKSDSIELSPPDLEANAEDQTNINREELQEIQENEESGETEAEPRETVETVDFTLNDDDLGHDGDDEVLDLSSLEANFGKFLDIQVEILVEETEDVTDIEEENGEMLSLEVGDIIHPAVDANAKWDLNTLFNELELP